MTWQRWWFRLKIKSVVRTVNTVMKVYSNYPPFHPNFTKRSWVLNASFIQFIPIVITNDLHVAKSWSLSSGNDSSASYSSSFYLVFPCYNLLFMLQQNDLSTASIQIISSMRERTLTVTNSLQFVAPNPWASTWHTVYRESLSEYCWMDKWTNKKPSHCIPFTGTK